MTGLSWAVLFHMALVGLQLSVGLPRLECLRQFGSCCWESARRLTGAVDQNTAVLHVFSPCGVDFLSHGSWVPRALPSAKAETEGSLRSSLGCYIVLLLTTFFW